MGITLGLLIALPRRTEAEPPQASFPSAEATTSPKTLVERYASFYDVPVGKNIVSCESRFNSKAKNPRSTAKGLYQFLDSTWEMYSKRKWGYVPDVYDPRFNAELGAWVIATYGTRDWVASQDCWGAF